MPAKRVYLDSSSIVKRYVEEKGSAIIDRTDDAAETGILKVHFSIWNVGEVLGALDRYVTRKILEEDEFRTSVSDFLSESIKLGKLGTLVVSPLASHVLTEAWLILVRQHIYEADALQVATAKSLNCDVLLTADRSLVDTCRRESVASFDVETEQEKILDTIMS
jgi:predicted nucleic acid-binding protein